MQQAIRLKLQLTNKNNASYYNQAREPYNDTRSNYNTSIQLHQLVACDYIIITIYLSSRTPSGVLFCCLLYPSYQNTSNLQSKLSLLLLYQPIQYLIVCVSGKRLHSYPIHSRGPFLCLHNPKRQLSSFSLQLLVLLSSFLFSSLSQLLPLHYLYYLSSFAPSSCLCPVSVYILFARHCAFLTRSLLSLSSFLLVFCCPSFLLL